MRPLVALSGAWLPVSVLTYLYRGLLAHDVDILRIGTWPSEGTHQPWETDDGQGYKAPLWSAPKPHVHVRDDGRVFHEPGDELVERAQREGVALWLDIDGGWCWDAHLPFGAQRRALVITDPHVRGWRSAEYASMRGRVTEVWQMQSGPWMQEGDHLLPYAFDYEWHKPVDVTQSFDVTILGQPYEARREIARRLRKAGLRVLGPGVVGIGTEYSAALCRAPVALVWPLADDLPARVFEAAACGVGVITKAVPDLDLILPDRDLPGLRLADSLSEFVLTTIWSWQTVKREIEMDPLALWPLCEGHSWRDRARRLLNP